MASPPISFNAPLIKEKGASLEEINLYVNRLGTFCKNLKSVTLSVDAFDDTLQASLDAGVTNVLAGVGSDFRLHVDTINSYITIAHKDADHTASVGAYSGTLRTGTFWGANGIGFGFNRKVDGVWQTTIVLDGTTGNASILGTLIAGSVVAGSVTIGSGGNALSLVDTRAANGQTVYNSINVNTSTLLKGVLRPDTTGAIALGTITWNSITGALTGGSGIAMTAAGIIAAQSGTPTLTITATGFVTVSGDVVTQGQVHAYGSTNTGLGVNAAIFGESVSDRGVFGSSQNSAGVQGYSTGSTVNSHGVIGYTVSASGYGVWGLTNGGTGVIAGTDSGIALRAYLYGGASGVAFQCDGLMTINNATLVTNLNANYLQGYTSGSFALSGHTHSGVYSPVGHGHNLSDITINQDINMGSYKMTKTHVNGDRINIYDAISHAFLATYEWEMF